MSGRGKKHIHKYHRVTTQNGYLWCCALPDCSHYMPKHLEMLLNGKVSICWNCDEPKVILDENIMRHDRPVCSDCTPNVPDVDNLLTALSIKE